LDQKNATTKKKTDLLWCCHKKNKRPGLSGGDTVARASGAEQMKDMGHDWGNFEQWKAEKMQQQGML